MDQIILSHYLSLGCNKIMNGTGKVMPMDFFRMLTEEE